MLLLQNGGTFFNPYLFPPLSVISKCLQQIHLEQAHVLFIALMWSTQSWFPKLIRMLTDVPIFFSIGSFKAPLQEGLCSQASQDTSVDGMSFVRQLYAQRGVSESSANILCASWRNTTKFQYSGYIKKWLCFL